MAKSGLELFRELKRIYAVAQVEDYFKNGVWRDDLMRTDLQLIAVHRREAGAPQPPELSEVEMPPLPPGAAAATSATSLAAASGLGDSVADLRLIALFVAKWKLDMAATRKTLVRFMPMRRRYIMATFKAKGGPDVNAELEQYIQECSSTNSWAAAMAPRPLTSSPVQVRPRPVTSSLNGVSPRPVTSSLNGVRPRPVTSSISAVRPRPVTPSVSAVRPRPMASSVNGGLSLHPGVNRVRPPLTIQPRKPGPTSAGVISSGIQQRLAALRAQARPTGVIPRAAGIGMPQQAAAGRLIRRSYPY